MNEKIAKDVANILLSIGAVTFRFDPPFTYTSGIKGPIYLDNRLVMSYPNEREKIIEYYLQVIKDKIKIDTIDYISATATAAIPQGAWIADRLKLPLVYVRPTAKGHGKENKLEGYIKKGARVLIIEDHISTAGSVIGNAQTVRQLDGIVQYCVATTNYETKESRQQLEHQNIQLFTLTTGTIIIEEALKHKILTEPQLKSIEEWFSDPIGWAKKYGYE